MKNILIIAGVIVLVVAAIGLYAIFGQSGSGAPTDNGGTSFPGSGASGGAGGGVSGGDTGSGTSSSGTGDTGGAQGGGTSGTTGETGSGSTGTGGISGTGSGTSGGTGSGTSGTSSGSSGSTPSNGTISLATRGGGGPVTVTDFIHNGVTVEDTENPGNFYLAGAVGYCLKNGTCPTGAKVPDFIIMYNAAKQVFTISLTQEPIGTARAHAEQFMQQTLGITGTPLCNLSYYLSTTSYVNGTYAGKNLGFSFCPSATKLPS